MRLYVKTQTAIQTEYSAEAALCDSAAPEVTRRSFCQAQKMNALGAIAGGVVHDINNPLSGIINYAELLREESEEAASDARQNAEMIVQETHRAVRVIRTFFDFLRVDDGEPAPTSVRDLAAGTETLACAVLRHSGIDFQVEVIEDLPMVNCKEQAVRQVLLNLLLNARQAVNDQFQQANGEKRIWLRAGRAERGGARYIFISVEDNGIGMDEQVLNQAATPFFTTRDTAESMGLGLAVSQEIVDEHQGILELDSTPGKGTVALVLLPVDE